MDMQNYQPRPGGMPLPMMMPGMMPMMPYPYPGMMPGMMPGMGGKGQQAPYAVPNMTMPPGMLGVPGLGMERPELQQRILNQLEYYFSDENLKKDTYLRGQLDEEGWTSLDLVCGFNRVKSLLMFASA